MSKCYGVSFKLQFRGIQMSKKIMFIDKNKVVNYAGGVEKVICSFANEFAKRNYVVYFVCMDTEEGMPFFELNKNVEFINLCYEYSNYNFVNTKYQLKKIQKEIMRGIFGKKLNFFGKKFKDPKECYFYNEFSTRLKACINDKRPDILLPTDVESTEVVINICEKLQEKPAIISMCHSDPNFLTYTQKEIQALKKCDAVQVLLPVFADVLGKLGIQNTIVIPNALKLMKVASNNNEFSTKRIINVARIDGGGKQQDVLIKAFSMVEKDFPEWTLSFWGDIANKRYKKKLDKLVKELSLTNKVSFYGTTSNIFKEYETSDIFAFPSKHEGFGIAMVEAMSMGLPVVAFKSCSGPANIINDGVDGFLCDDGIENFSNKLRMLMSNGDLRKNLGLNAQRKALKYSDDIVWEKWEFYINKYIKN